MRLIDADRLELVLEKNFGHTSGADVMRQLIDSQPTVDALPYDYILNIEEELRQKARESESQERKGYYFENAEAIQRLLITREMKGRRKVRGYDEVN